jgi:hypothetical protein
VSDALPRSLPAHPCWHHVAPLISVEAGTLLASGRRHRRIELRSERLSDSEIDSVLAVRIACAACGAPIAAFRRRKGRRGNAGRAKRPSRLFVSVTCPLSARMGCARGAAATRAYEHLIAALRPPPDPPPPQPRPSPALVWAARQLELRVLL